MTSLNIILEHMPEFDDKDPEVILKTYNELELDGAVSLQDMINAIKDYIIAHMDELKKASQQIGAARKTIRKNKRRSQRGGVVAARALRALAGLALAGTAVAAVAGKLPTPSSVGFRMPAISMPAVHFSYPSPYSAFLGPAGGAGAGPAAAPNGLSLNSVADPAAKARVAEFRDAYHAYVTKGLSRPNRPATNLCASGEMNCGTYPRSIMPQIKDIGVVAFVERLQGIDPRVSLEEDKMKVNKMTFSQSEVDRDRALRKKEKYIAQGKLKRKNAIVVSNDGYIVDGHHTAAGILLAGAGGEKVHVVKINKPIKWILEAAAAVDMPRAAV